MEKKVQKPIKTSGEFRKSARIISDYENDMLFEQPREGLIMQEFISYEEKSGILYKKTITRKFNNGDYNDSSTSQVLKS